MRLSRVTLALWCLAACSKHDAPAPPGAPVIEATEEAADEPVVYPTRPTPAFVPRENGACSRAYRLVEDTCVHRYYEQNHAGGMAQAIAAYKRGVAPPMLGPVPTRASEPSGPKRLDPGALTKARASGDDAGTPKDRRLADLDVMLAAAREKLRLRDEASKAKKVENAPKRGGAPAAPDTQTPTSAFAQNTAGGSAAGGSASGDPAVARLNELTQIAHQLGSEQLKALTTELGRSGINTSALENLMRTEGGDNVRR